MAAHTPQHMQYKPPVTLNEPSREARMEKYARQTRTATVVIAWIVSLLLVSAVAMGVFIGVKAGQSGNGSTTSSNCLSQGGTDPSC